MKSILKIGMAIAVVAVSLQTGPLSTAWAATPGDAVFFSTSATDPNAGTSVTLSPSAPSTLYIWVTSAGGTTDSSNDAITPINTGYSGNIAAGAAALNLSGALTGVTGNLNLTSVTFDNPTLGGSNGATRWSALSNYTTPAAGTNFTTTTFTNFETNAALPNLPNAITAGTHMGLATANSGGIDPLYFPITVPNSSTPGAWKVGQVNFTTTTTAGQSTLTLSAGGLGVTKSQTGATTDLTSLYSYGSASITVGGGNRTGDLNADGAINALDLDIEATAIRTVAPYDVLKDFRGQTIGSPPDGIVDQHDMDRHAGSLVDINGGGAGGAHGTQYGDANLDGVVNQLDLNAVSQNFLKTGQGWATGNFNGTVDTVVNQLDLNSVSQNFLKTGGTGQIASVPEPTTCVLFAFGGLAMLAAARRRRS